MRTALLLCVLAPATALALVVPEMGEGATVVSDVQVLSVYAALVCVWMVFRFLRRRSWHAVLWATALVLSIFAPTTAALLFLAFVTALVVLLGLSRR